MRACVPGVLQGAQAHMCSPAASRRHNALRLSISGHLSRQGAASEVTPDSVAAAGQAAAPRRRRHRRLGSFGSLGYPAAQAGGLSPRHPASRGGHLGAAETHTRIAPLGSMLETPAATLQCEPSRSIDQAKPECTPSMTAVQEGASGVSGQPGPAGQGLHEANHLEQLRDSTATELPEEWVTALHSAGSSGAPAQALTRGSADVAAGSVQDKMAAGNGAMKAHKEQASSSQTQPSGSRSSQSLFALSKR